MKENGSTIRGRVPAMRGLAMETHMKENIRKARCMGRAGMCGIPVSIMRDNGRRVSRTVMVFGVVGRVIHTSDNGKTTSLMDSVSTLGVMEMSMKESGRHV